MKWLKRHVILLLLILLVKCLSKSFFINYSFRVGHFVGLNRYCMHVAFPLPEFFLVISAFINI